MNGGKTKAKKEPITLKRETKTLKRGTKTLKKGTKTLKKTLKRGEFKWRVKDNTSYVQWMDSKLVHLLSTAFDPTETTTVTRTQKDGSKKLLNCPVVIPQYTNRMGGVDRFDQKRSTYIVGRRSKRWWLRLFYFIIDAAITNAFILYSSISRSGKPITNLQFRNVLGDQLVALHSGRKVRVRTLVKKSTKSKPKSYGLSDEVRLNDVGSHMPVEIKSSRRCRLCSSKTNNKRSRIECLHCKVPLCIVPCFLNFHKN